MYDPLNTKDSFLLTMDMNEHDFYIRISSSTAGSTTSQPRTENTAESRTGTPHTNTDSAAHHLTCMLQLSMASQYFIPVISACNTAKRACTRAKIVVSESTTIILMHCEQRVFTWAADVLNRQVSIMPRYDWCDHAQTWSIQLMLPL